MSEKTDTKPKRKKALRQYLYTYREVRSNHGRDRRVRLYSVKRNKVEFVGEYKDSFMSEGQLVGTAAVKLGLITKHEVKMLLKDKPYAAYTAWQWKDRGVAEFTEID